MVFHFWILYCDIIITFTRGRQSNRAFPLLFFFLFNETTIDLLELVRDNYMCVCMCLRRQIARVCGHLLSPIYSELVISPHIFAYPS